jgi:hypothetical protein
MAAKKQRNSILFMDVIGPQGWNIHVIYGFDIAFLYAFLEEFHTPRSTSNKGRWLLFQIHSVEAGARLQNTIHLQRPARLMPGGWLRSESPSCRFELRRGE